MTIHKIFLMFVAIFAVLAFAGSARADEVTFTLTQNTCSGGCSPSPFATVIVADTAANTVTVTETLSGATQFVSSGSGYALAFSVKGNPTLAISSLTSNFSIGNELTGQTESKDGAGIYEYWITCSGCGSGGSPPIVQGPLSFTVAAPGLTAADFEVANANGYYVASDVLASMTGNVEANGYTVTVTPEPSSIALFSTGLVGVGLMSRKRLFAQAP